MTPYWQHDRATLYAGDALAVLASLPEASVDAVITDPPYSSGGMVRGDRMAGTHYKYLSSDSAARDALAEFSGDNRDQRSYGYWCALWLAECLRVTRPRRHLPAVHRLAAAPGDHRRAPVRGTCELAVSPGGER